MDYSDPIFKLPPGADLDRAVAEAHDWALPIPFSELNFSRALQITNERHNVKLACHHQWTDVFGKWVEISTGTDYGVRWRGWGQTPTHALSRAILKCRHTLHPSARVFEGDKIEGKGTPIAIIASWRVPGQSETRSAGILSIFDFDHRGHVIERLKDESMDAEQLLAHLRERGEKNIGRMDLKKHAGNGSIPKIWITGNLERWTERAMKETNSPAIREYLKLLAMKPPGLTGGTQIHKPAE